MRSAGRNALDNAHDMRSPIRWQLAQRRGEILGVEGSFRPQRDGGDREVVAVRSRDGVGDTHVDRVEDAECIFDSGTTDRAVGSGDERVGTAGEPVVAILIAVEQVSGQ